MTEETGASSLSSKRRSRCVTMPTTLLPTTTGTPEMPRARVRSSTSRIVMSGGTVIGSRMTPLSNFFTRPTSRACASIGHALVNDADAAFLGDGDGEARLGDGVHGGRQQRQIEADAAGELGGEVDLARQNFRVGRDQQDVIEGEGFFEDAHAQL